MAANFDGHDQNFNYLFTGDAFGGEPRVDPIEAGRDELALMQPMATTLSNAPATSRVFEMIRLLASVRCYKMTAGNPDSSVQRLEEVFAQ